MNNLDTIIPVTELRRNFGAITASLAKIPELILTKGGEPFAILKAVPKEKKKLLKKSAGVWKNTRLDDDKLWQTVMIRKSRKNPLAL